MLLPARRITLASMCLVGWSSVVHEKQLEQGTYTHCNTQPQAQLTHGQRMIDGEMVGHTTGLAEVPDGLDRMVD